MKQALRWIGASLCVVGIGIIYGLPPSPNLVAAQLTLTIIAGILIGYALGETEPKP